MLDPSLFCLVDIICSKATSVKMFGTCTKPFLTHESLTHSDVKQLLQHLIHSFFLDSPKKLFILFLDERLLTVSYIITSFCGLLPLYHQRMASIVARIGVVLVNRELNDGSVNWPQVKISSNDFLLFMKWATSSYFRNL